MDYYYTYERSLPILKASYEQGKIYLCQMRANEYQFYKAFILREFAPTTSGKY